MPKKYVSLDKMSKRAQKEAHAQKRQNWGTVVPITRAKPSAKQYNRKKSKHAHVRNHEPLGYFFCALHAA